MGWDWDCATVAGFWCESRPCDSHSALRLIHLGASRESCASCESCASRASRVCPVCLVCVSIPLPHYISPTSPRSSPIASAATTRCVAAWPVSENSQQSCPAPEELPPTPRVEQRRPVMPLSKNRLLCHLSHYSMSIALLVIYRTTRYLLRYSLSIALLAIERRPLPVDTHSHRETTLSTASGILNLLVSSKPWTGTSESLTPSMS